MTGLAFMAMAGAQWHWSALNAMPMLRWLILAVLCTGALALGMVVLSRLGCGQVSPRRLGSDCRGTATIEFALVFPLLLILSLILLQTTLLMGANVFVHYAAFAATRSAVVQIPAYFSDDEPTNVVINAPGWGKYEAIRRAGVLALLPVAGPLEAGNTSTQWLTQGLERYYAGYDRTTPRWVDGLLPSRLRYADANTSLDILRTQTEGQDRVIFSPMPSEARPDRSQDNTMGPHDPITVKLTHRLYLSVPYVRMVFADGQHTPNTGVGRYTTVSAQYTLTNEGVEPGPPPRPTRPSDDTVIERVP